MSEPTIAELFLTDPLELTDRKFEIIIEYYRGQRINFNTAAKAGVTGTQAKKAAVGAEKAKELGFDTDKLDLGL